MTSEDVQLERRHTARAETLLRKLVAVAEGIVVSGHDCGTPRGVIKKVGERDLAGIIRGRVSRQAISVVPGEVVVRENELITAEQAQEIEKLGLDCVVVRSPMACLAPHGVCQLCYGADPASGRLVEEGAAVGLLAARTLGEAAARLTGRPFPGETGGVSPEESEIRSKKAGKVKFERITDVVNDKGEHIALTRNGEIGILGANDRVLESFVIPNGSILLVTADQEVQAGTPLVRWDPHVSPILTEVAGRVFFDEIIEGETLHIERSDGAERYVIMEHKGDLHPQVIIEDERGLMLAGYYMPEKAYLEVRPGQTVSPGTVLARWPREESEVLRGVPRLTELFEARRPRDPAILAEVSGRVRIGERKRGKRSIWVESEDLSIECEHRVSQRKHLRIHSNDYVHCGQPLTVGPPRLHDILRILGEEATQRHLVDEVQAAYQSQGLEIDDRHIEIIVSQMLRHVRVHHAGDTELQPGTLVDKFAFSAANIGYKEWVKVESPGESKFSTGEIVRTEAFNEELTRLQPAGKKPPKSRAALPATCAVQLLGISEVLKFRDRQ
jgi:DNA-directed RNA polymerase subunit beta'